MAVVFASQPECEAAHHRIRILACGAARLTQNWTTTTTSNFLASTSRLVQGDVDKSYFGILKTIFITS